MEVQWVCKRCEHTTKTKGNLLVHLNKKQPCAVTKENVSIAYCIEELTKKAFEGKYHICEECEAQFTTRQAKSKHKKTSCKGKSTIQDADSITAVVNKDDVIETLQQQNQMLLQRIELIEERIGISNSYVEAPFDTHDELISDGFQPTDNYDFTQEKFFQKVLESIYGGSHMKFDGGESDITTNEAHVEIKRWTCWKEIEGQLSAYNYFSKRDKLIACCFGPYQDYSKNIAYQVLTSKGIEVFDCQFCEKTNMFTYLNMTTNEKREILIMNV
jgi:hypothetical protein